MRWLHGARGCLALLLWTCVAEAGDRYERREGSFLVGRTVQAPDGRQWRTTAAYAPAVGDLAFFDNGGPIKKGLFALTMSGPPTHCGIFVPGREEGSLALLHAVDPFWKGEWTKVEGITPGRVNCTEDWRHFFVQYPGPVWIRRLEGRVTKVGSDALRRWAARQEGKRYGTLKTLRPPLGFPTQTPLHILGPADTEQETWHCSSIVAAALVELRIFDRWEVRPVQTDPQDLFSGMLLPMDDWYASPRRWSSYTVRRVPPRAKQGFP